jgi:hypothetical protein
MEWLERNCVCWKRREPNARTFRWGIVPILAAMTIGLEHAFTFLMLFFGV